MREALVAELNHLLQGPCLYTPERFRWISLTKATHRLLDQKEGSGRMDIIDDLSAPLPILVTAEMLGIPPQDRINFRHNSNAVISFDSARTAEAHRVFPSAGKGGGICKTT